MAKSSSNNILGLGKPLRSGQGAIRQFWNPIKPERGPAAASPTTFWAWGSLCRFWNPIKPAMAPAAAWLKPAPTRSGQAAIRQSWNPIKPHRNPIKPGRVPAETMLKPRSSWAWGSSKRDKGFGSPKQVRGSGTVDGGFERKQRSTPTVVPGAALPWPRRGRVGGYRYIHMEQGWFLSVHCQRSPLAYSPAIWLFFL